MRIHGRLSAWLQGGLGSAGRDAAINEERLAGYASAGFGGEKDERPVKIDGAPWQLRGGAIPEVLHPCRVWYITSLMPLG